MTPKEPYQVFHYLTMWEENVLKIYPSLINDYIALLICRLSCHLRCDHNTIPCSVYTVNKPLEYFTHGSVYFFQLFSTLLLVSGNVHCKKVIVKTRHLENIMLCVTSSTPIRVLYRVADKKIIIVMNNRLLLRCM